MALTLYNSIARLKQLFKPITPNLVKIYVCGPTVYDHPHLGNARSCLVYDMLYRFLCLQYKKVIYVRNITDVDDKIIGRARELNISIEELAKQTTMYFQQDMEYLNCLRPTYEPKATEHIAEMIEMIETLLLAGYAYESEKHIYFDVSKAKDYDILSNRSLLNNIQGEHVRELMHKRASADFVLWKPDLDAASGFASPFGRGRPGWHIECSAMAHKYLGENFDIHGGGADLIFPHHTNEIAQSTSAYPGSGFASLWVHNGFLTVNGEKMSKSLGNFVTVRDLIKQNIEGEVIRLALLKTHYRKPLDYKLDSSLSNAKIMLNYWYKAIKLANIDANDGKITTEIIKALENDLNVPLAIKILNDYAKRVIADSRDVEAANSLLNGANFMGLLMHKPAQWFKNEIEDEWIEKLISERTSAKKSHNFTLADKIRSELLNKGIILEDTPGGTQWRKH